MSAQFEERHGCAGVTSVGGEGGPVTDQFEERHGFAGARRASGGLGGPWLGPPFR
jgi:hypothetical protein